MTKVGANWVFIGALRVFKGSMNAVQFVVFVRKRCKGYSFMTKVSCGLPFQGLVSDPCTSDPSSSSLVVSPVSYSFHHIRNTLGRKRVAPVHHWYIAYRTLRDKNTL